VDAEIQFSDFRTRVVVVVVVDNDYIINVAVVDDDDDVIKFSIKPSYSRMQYACEATPTLTCLYYSFTPLCVIRRLLFTTSVSSNHRIVAN